MRPETFVGLQAEFAAVSLLILVALFALVRKQVSLRAAGIFATVALAWAGSTFFFADAGWLASFDSVPPKPVPVFVFGLGLSFLFAFGPWGKALRGAPWAWLIGLQAFRILVEFAIHHAVVLEVAPPQLTWSGLNLDIITGVTAVPVAWLAHQGKLSNFWLAAWNVLGLVLLLVVVVVALVSMPTPLQQLTPDNTWIAWPPFVWLPTLLVSAALALHLISFRKLRAQV